MACSFLLLPVAFFIGMLLAAPSAQNQGLAGGTIVFFGGIIGGVVGLVLSFILMKKMTRKMLIRLNWILTIILIGIIGWFAYRIHSNKKESVWKREFLQTRTLAFAEISAPNLYEEKGEMGLGMATPKFYENPVLYFYNPNLEKSVMEHLPADSIVFKQLETGGLSTTYAPPWLMPRHLKLDYDMFYFKVVSFTPEWMQVEVNRQNGLTRWVARSDVNFHYWPDFLLNVNTTENPDPKGNPVRVKPLDHAGLENTPHVFMKPVQFQNEWMQVEHLDGNFKTVGKGWIRWRNDGKLLVTYSLLS